ncbi:MAG: pyruvate, phosphate dikinase [Actinobacteria bacterium]|nr:pyruvate, phosphate dikinase [Actinomycetota bacterium]
MTTKYVYAFAEGNRDLKDLLGGKGANLAEMTRLGIPVPPGFIITTDACKKYLSEGKAPLELEVQVTRSLRRLEDESQKRFGDGENPLLISVRSGAKNSMPGMMETILNVGLNDKSVVGLGEQTKNPRFAWDAYRRLIQMFGKTVLGIEGSKFANAMAELSKSEGVTQDHLLSVSALQRLVTIYKEIVETESGSPFPQDPRAQLDLSVYAVFDSWNTERAKLYRRRERIADDLGTAVNVVAMVFGNMGEDSGTGVCFTRDPATGERGAYGDYLANAQGEDVVSGIRTPLTLADFRTKAPKLFDELAGIMYRLETHYRDICDIEFTVERGKLWILQTRVAKRTPAAAFRIAIQLVDEQLITMDEALMRVTGNQLAQLMFPQFQRDDAHKPIAIGIPASPGAAVGAAVFDSIRAAERAATGEKVILIRRETNPDDLGGMLASVGILTSRGGKTSHAAVVARGVGKTAVCGAEDLEVNEVERFALAGQARINEGDLISIDGLTGEIYNLEVPVAPSTVVTYLKDGITNATQNKDEATQDLIKSIDRLLRHADRRRRLLVRANADTAADSDVARRFGAEGIGLCRTEHMFLGERRVLIERVILADTQKKRDDAFAVLLPMQRKDFREMLEVMDGLATTIRLLDPPLHEFLPDLGDLKVKSALAKERGEKNESDEELLHAVARMHESNPMLGLRGVRLGLVFAGLYELQVRAIAEAMADRIEVGGNPKVEIMIPLVGSHMELKLTRQSAERVIKEVEVERRVELPIDIGTMIELPRAALTANRIGMVADFFSFGTNDLTQTTWGFSRDDVEAEFFSRYLELGVFTISPFETIDQFGVGELMQIAVERGRQSNPNIHLGVCGEHGGDPESIHFFNSIGLDYVSCSPYRVPVARLEAGRAALASI